jgi:UDP-N-acetylmuramoyl-tripeptide--D-alanyl-D-alanine ligase
MIAEILAVGGPTLSTQGNFNNLIGLPITLFRLEKGHGYAVLEMGMNRPGEIARLTQISNPDVGIITNVGMAHLEGVGDIQGVAAAKVELIHNISSGGKVILNADDELLMETASRFQREYVTFGFKQNSTVRCTELEILGPKGSRFHLHFRDKPLPVKLNVPGLQNVSNAMAAATVAFCLKAPFDHIAEGLNRFKGVEGRFSLIPLFNGATLVDDTYNANPSSLKAALESAAAMVGKEARLIVGLGDMMELGSAAVSLHRDAGRMVAKFNAACLVTIGEYSQEIRNAAIEGGMTPSRVHSVTSHNEMAEIISAEIKKGDLILLKGSRKMDLGKVVNNLRVVNS